MFEKLKLPNTWHDDQISKHQEYEKSHKKDFQN